MKARRTILFLLMSAMGSATLWSQVTADFGLTIKNSSAVLSAENVGLVQGDQATAWFRLEGPQTTFRLRGTYSLSYRDQVLSQILDVERLSLSRTVPGDGKPLSRFGFSLGRRPVAGSTGLVINQALDGFGLTMAYPVASVTASLGTTFLPNKATGPVVMSRADAADYNNSSVLLGSPRLIGIVELLFPSVLRQQITLSVAMQEDLRGLLALDALADTFAARTGVVAEGTATQDPSRGGLVDTQYSSLVLRGNITGGLFYNAFFTLNTGRTLSYVTPVGSAQGNYEYTPILAGLGGVGISVYAEKVLGSVAGLRFVYSSGDSWEDRSSVVESSVGTSPNLFIPVTGVPLSVVFAPTLGNIAFVEATYSMRPFAGPGATILGQLQFGLTASVFLRPTAGPISVTIPNTSSTSMYLGSEADLSVTFRPFSDLALQATSGIFLPNSAQGASNAESGPFLGKGLQWKVDIGASMSF